MECNRKCFECRNADCYQDQVDELDAYISHLLDKDAIEADHSTRHYIYNHSAKRKAASKKYLATEKGKATHERSWKSYAEKHPERLRAKSRLYYMRHKEEILERARNKRKEGLHGKTEGTS